MAGMDEGQIKIRLEEDVAPWVKLVVESRLHGLTSASDFVNTALRAYVRGLTASDKNHISEFLEQVKKKEASVLEKPTALRKKKAS